MARARKGGDPAARRFQASFQNLKRTQGTQAAAAAPEPAVDEAGEPKAEQPERTKAKTKLR